VAKHPIKIAETSDLAAWSMAEPLELTSRASDTEDNPLHAGLDWPTLLRRLSSVEQLAAGEQLKLFGDLVRMLRRKEAGVDDLLRALREADAIRRGPESALFRTVVGALASAGGTAAHRALTQLYSDPTIPVTGKGTILAAFTTTEAEIDRSTRKFLAERFGQETNRDLAEGAGFALGSALQKAANDSQARSAIQQVLNAYEATESLRGRLALLDVMGNSGRSEFLARLGTVIDTEKNSELRARAAFSLRFIRTDQAREKLGRALLNPDQRVRGAAVAAIRLAEWTETFRAPVRTCVNQEPVAQIQSSCRGLESDHPMVAGR
jgi:hypothetical protein